MATSIFPIEADTLLKWGSPPKPKDQKRAITKHDFKHPWLQVLSDTVSTLDPVVDIIKKNPEKVNPESWKHPKSLVEKYSDGIEMHVFQRVDLFFQMSIVCFDLPSLYFESSGEAEEQYGSAPKIKLSEVGGDDEIDQAAHPSTFPSLYICKREEWDDYQAGKREKPKQVIFLANAHGSKRHNSTNGLPHCVNETDSLIDWKAKGNPLRKVAIEIVNLVALKVIDPVEATQRFVKAFKTRIKELLKKPPNERVKAVLEKYLENIRWIHYEIKRFSNFFDHLLHISFGLEDQKTKSLREIVYPKQYEIIRADQCIDARIQSRLKNANITYEPGDSKEFLKFALLLNTQGSERTLLEKLFCKTAVVFEDDFKKSLLTSSEEDNKKIEKDHAKFLKKLEAFCQRNLKEIWNLLDDIREDIAELRRSEAAYRALLFKDLMMKIQHWSQREFSEEFKKKYPDDSMSPTMVSRLLQPTRLVQKLEYKTPTSQRFKDMTRENVPKYADILGVNASLFFPQVFASILA